VTTMQRGRPDVTYLALSPLFYTKMNCEAGNDNSNLPVFGTGLRARHFLPLWNLHLAPQALAKLSNVS
jgi:hypothetical protein